MAASVVESPLEVDDEEVELVRQALDHLDDMDRRTLWQCLDLIDRIAASGGGADRLSNAVYLAPEPVRPVVVKFAALRLRQGQLGPSAPERAPRLTPHHGRTLNYLTGRAADHDSWTHRWTWSSFSPEAFDRTAHRYAEHVVPLLYRHTGDPLGLTRTWWRSDDGDLDVEATFLPVARAQQAAAAAKDGLLCGLSIGMRPVHSDWSYLSPREWEPRTLSLDMARHHDVVIEELSIAPYRRNRLVTSAPSGE